MNDITPQEPGTIAGVEQSKIEHIVSGTAGDVAESLDGLTIDELNQLFETEQSGKARKTVLSAVRAEIDSRDGGEPVQPVAYSLDEHPYANKRAADVDPSKIKFRVLTLDGWVLPAETNLE